MVKEQYKIKLIENKIYVSYSFLKQARFCIYGNLPEEGEAQISVDELKMGMIDFEFFISLMENIVDFLHYGTLFYIRWQNICLFDLFFIGKQLVTQTFNFKNNIWGFIEYKFFIYCIKKNLEEVNYDLSKPQEEKEICPICQDNIAKGIKLKCNHVYHQFCIVQYI